MKNLFTLGSKDIGIDLGTANILVTIKGKGIVLREPSVVAIDIKTGDILATGHEAKEMLGRTPENIKAVRPLKDGVIADFTATQLLLKNILRKVCQRYNARRPRVVVGVPSGITEVEEPMAAAIGSGLNVADASGSMVVDIGGGTTEVAVVSLGGIVISKSLRIAGDEFNEDIINYIKREENIAIGETTAEEVKIKIGCVDLLMTDLSMEVRGRDLGSGLPRNIIIKSSQVMEATKESVDKIVETIKQALEKTPPELASDLIEKGIMLTGGGALMQNFDKLLSRETNIPIYIANDPLDCVVKGTEKTLEDLEKLKQVFINSRKRRRI